MEANNTIPANFKPTRYTFNGQPVYKCDGLFVLATGQFVFRRDLEKIENKTTKPTNTQSAMNTNAGEIENDMKKFILSWEITESDFQNPLESVSNIRKPVYSLEFDTYKEAFEAFQKELSATTLMKCCDLDFSPSDHELRTSCCALMVTMVDSEDDIVQVMESSEYYWIG